MTAWKLYRRVRRMIGSDSADEQGENTDGARSRDGEPSEEDARLASEQRAPDSDMHRGQADEAIRDPSGTRRSGASEKEPDTTGAGCGGKPDQAKTAYASEERSEAASPLASASEQAQSEPPSSGASGDEACSADDLREDSETPALAEREPPVSDATQRSATRESGKEMAREDGEARPGVNVEGPPGEEEGWDGRPLSPYSVGHPGRAALEVVPKLPKEPIGRADTSIDACRVGSLEIRAASARGWSHRQESVTRQDEYCLAESAGAGWLIVAVADGVSAGPLSHYAATMAARQGCAELAEQLRSPDADAQRIDWARVLHSVTTLIYKQGRQRLPPSSGVTDHEAWVERNMASAVCYALLATVPDEDGSFAAHVLSLGDISVWTRRNSGGWARLVGGKELAEGIASSEVAALPSRRGAAPEPTATQLPNGSTLLIVTDGVGDAMGDGAGQVARFLASVWRHPPDPLSFTAQLTFARKGIDDDRTAVVVWPQVP